MLDGANVLLLTDDVERRRMISAMLVGSGVRVTQHPQHLVDSDHIDVIVAEYGAVAELFDDANKRLLRGQPGIISIGASPVADVSLPSDFSRRELKVSCLLLAEIVRLRRQIRRSQRAQQALEQISSPAEHADGGRGG